MAAVVEVVVAAASSLGPSKGPPRQQNTSLKNSKFKNVAQNGVLGGTLHIGSQLATIAYY